MIEPLRSVNVNPESLSPRTIEVQVASTKHIRVSVDEYYLERYPKPGKLPRRIKVTWLGTRVLNPQHPGSILIGASTVVSAGDGILPDELKPLRNGPLMAYTLYSHWKKVD